MKPPSYSKRLTATGLNIYWAVCGLVFAAEAGLFFWLINKHAWLFPLATLLLILVANYSLRWYLLANHTYEARALEVKKLKAQILNKSEKK